jgi:predicted CXXCH cytochrome family protein
MRLVPMFCVLLLVGLLMGVPARAFHDGGVASCSSCHVMHESEDGQQVDASGELLRGVSGSDLCLGCHADANGAVFGVSPLAPPPERGPGNFVFLLEDNLNDGTNGGTNPIAGEAAGHSIVAPSVGLVAETRWVSAPGGSYPSSELSCTSCHDPHGNANYRMLWGAGETEGGDFSFQYAAPTAVGLPLDGPPESRSNHVAYRRGMSAWCSNCHGFYHDEVSGPGFHHDFDADFERGMLNRYAVYDGDANPAGGEPSTSYLPEAPYQDPTATRSTTGPPSTSSRAMCLTCHRAHATSSPAAGRWDFRVQYLQEDGVESGSYAIPNPYPDPSQGRLCAKCHPGQGGGF